MIQRFQTGQRWTDSGTMAQLNALVDAANRLAGLRGDALIHVHQTAYGTALGFSVEGLLPYIPKPPARQAIRWAKAYEAWTDVAGNGSYVRCHPCIDASGTDENADLSLTIYLPRQGRDEDPNVQDDAVLPYISDDYDVAVGVSHYLDGKCGKTLRLHWDIAAIPAGWTVCDGSAGPAPKSITTPDFQARVFVGLKATDAEYDTVGEANSATKTHIHSAPDHYHGVEISLEGGADMAAGCGYDKDYITNTGPVGDGPGNTGATDHRDAYRVGVFIMRTH